MKIRLPGLVLLALCLLAMRHLSTLVNLLPRHAPSPVELGLGVLAVLAGLAGAALLTVGPALFRAYAWPPLERD